MNKAAYLQGYMDKLSVADTKKALKSILYDIKSAGPVARPGSRREPEHSRFGASHYGVSRKYGRHYAVKKGRDTIHFYPDTGEVFVSGPSPLRRGMSVSEKKLMRLLDRLREKEESK